MDAIATKAEHQAAVMLWNYHDDDLAGAWRCDVQVTIAGIPAGVKKVLLEHYRIDDTHSNSLHGMESVGLSAVAHG